MKIILYEPKYRNQLGVLLRDFANSVWDNNENIDIELFIENHWAIYLALKDNEVVGFSSYCFNHYFGLSQATIGNNYLYIKPEYRGSKAMYLFSLQSARISISNNLPIEHYYTSEDSLKLSKKLKGKKMYESYVYEVKEVKRMFRHLNKKVRIKE